MTIEKSGNKTVYESDRSFLDFNQKASNSLKQCYIGRLAEADKGLEASKNLRRSLTLCQTKLHRASFRKANLGR
jgi:hypothetical protein